MGHDRGQRGGVACGGRWKQGRKERKKKEEDIGRDGEQRVGGSWNQKAGKEENQGEVDQGEDIWCFFQVSSPWIIFFFFFGYHFIGCYRLFICWYSTCVAGFFLCFFDLTLKMVLLCFILCFFFSINISKKMFRFRNFASAPSLFQHLWGFLSKRYTIFLKNQRFLREPTLFFFTLTPETSRDHSCK